MNRTQAAPLLNEKFVGVDAGDQLLKWTVCLYEQYFSDMRCSAEDHHQSSLQLHVQHLADALMRKDLGYWQTHLMLLHPTH